MATCPDLDHCLAVDGQSVHRTQEAQSALAYALWQRVQQLLGTSPPTLPEETR
jgi:D-sedoheptulose 7-phosphate isomerase